MIDNINIVFQTFSVIKAVIRPKDVIVNDDVFDFAFKLVLYTCSFGASTTVSLFDVCIAIRA